MMMMSIKKIFRRQPTTSNVNPQADCHCDVPQPEPKLKKPSAVNRAFKKVSKVIKGILRKVKKPAQKPVASASVPVPAIDAVELVACFPLTLEETIQRQAILIDEMFAKACIGIDDMTEEQFEAHTVPEELLALTTAYFLNVQLQQSLMTQGALEVDETSDIVFDLSLLFWDENEESLHLDILFDANMEDWNLSILFELPYDHIQSPASVPKSFPIRSSRRLVKSCSFEHLVTMDDFSRPIERHFSFDDLSRMI